MNSVTATGSLLFVPLLCPVTREGRKPQDEMLSRFLSLWAVSQITLNDHAPSPLQGKN